MPVSVARLRRWFVGALVLVCLVVAGTYFYARHRVQNALKQIPGKLNVEYSQSAQQFTISKSEQGRTIFKLQASKAVQFKQSGRAELHDVTITLYGRDASRFGAPLRLRTFAPASAGRPWSAPIPAIAFIELEDRCSRSRPEGSLPRGAAAMASSSAPMARAAAASR